jgi:hypothetical protein
VYFAGQFAGPESMWEAARQVVAICEKNGRKPTSEKNIFYRISTKYKLYVTLRKSKHRKAAFVHTERNVVFEQTLQAECNERTEVINENCGAEPSREDMSYSTTPPSDNCGQPTAIAVNSLDSNSENFVLLEEPPVGALRFEYLSEEDDTADDDFEISSYYKEKLSPGPKPAKEKSLIDLVMASRDVVSVAERINLSTRHFLLFVAAIARAAGEDLDASTFSRTSFQKAREKLRFETVEMIQDNFQKREKLPLTVHWDGNLMQNLINLIDQKARRVVRR